MTGSVDQSLRILRERGVVEPVEIAILIGSGLGGIVDGVSDAISLPYTDLPCLPRLDEQGQAGRLTIGRLEGVSVCILQGQAHFYDSGDPACMSDPLDLVKALGARQMLIFSTAGSVRADLYPGSLALVTDHINLSGLNPLIGLVDSRAFQSLNDAYDARVQRRFKRAAASAGVTTHEGIYCWVSGPSFSTPAEIRAVRQLGGDLVGFAVAPEIILARRIGLRAGALVAVTHFSAGIQGSDPNPGECLQQALTASLGLRRILRAYLKTGETVA